MKKILIISYYYPPLSDVGSLRALGFSKYLPEYGWKPYVLSVSNPDSNFCLLGNEPVPSGVDVYYIRSIVNLMGPMGKVNGLLARTMNLFGFKLERNIFTDLFCIPDIFIGWIPLTVLKGYQLIKRYNIDLIYISCKPFSSTLIGTFLKKMTGRPLVVDLRDPTVANFSENKSLSLRFNTAANRAIERYVLKKVDHLLFVTRNTEKNYLQMYSFLDGKTGHIYNGFYNNINLQMSPEPFKKFTIVYVGNYYIDYIDSELIFGALKQLIADGNISKEDLCFLYLGSNTEWFKHMRAKYQLEDVIECPGTVSRKESIETLFKASIIYLRIVKDMISTKLYEGLATGNALLAAISNDEVIGLIKKYSENYAITPPGDEKAMVKELKGLYCKWKQGNLKRRQHTKYLQRFNKRYLTREFSKILNTTVGNLI